MSTAVATVKAYPDRYEKDFNAVVIELKKYSQEEYDSMSAAQHQELYELWKNAGLIKGKKTPESNRALKARVAMLEAKSENSSDESLVTDNDNTKPSYRSNPALDRKEKDTRQSHADA